MAKKYLRISEVTTICCVSEEFVLSLEEENLAQAEGELERADPRVKESLIPSSLIDNKAGPVRAVAVSDVGFIAAGYGNGSICVIDMRGPAVIYFSTVQSISKESKSPCICANRSSTCDARSKSC